jgi:hypothetical protein
MRTAAGDGLELQIVLPRKPKEVRDRPEPGYRQHPAPATQRGPKPQSVLDRVWRFRRALAVLQQPARDGEGHESARLQPHEQIDQDVMGQQEKPGHREARPPP